MQHLLGRLNLRHFRLIHAIAENGQLSTAADRVGLTQPAASRRIAEAERLIGQSLFERHAKGMKPTLYGEILCRHAVSILGNLDAAGIELQAISAGQSGTARIGAVTGAAVGFVTPAIRDLKRETLHPRIQIDVAPSTELMEGFLGGNYDFILARVPVGTDSKRLQILEKHVEHLEFLAHEGHPVAQRKKLTLDRLTGFLWVMQTIGMPIRDSVDRLFMAAGLPPPMNVIDSSSLLVTIAFLQGSDAISPVAREVSDLIRQTGKGSLVSLDLSTPVTLSPYYLIRSPERQMGPLAERLLNLIKSRMSRQDG